MTAEAGRLLVVNADDFGLTDGVCDGVLRAHRDGIVTSTSVLVPGRAFASRAPSLRDSGLPAGLHLCVVGEDPPLLSSREIPTLVGRDGRFPTSWRTVLRRAARGAIDTADLERELGAQADAFHAAGLRPTHVDSHQNLHLWPAVGDVAMAIAGAHAVPVIRVTRTRTIGPVGLGVRALARHAARRARARGFAVPDVAAGLDGAGAMDDAALRTALTHLSRGRGHADLTVHPGERHDPDRDGYAWGYAWGDELDALIAPSMRLLVGDLGFRLGSFADLAAAHPSGPAGRTPAT